MAEHQPADCLRLVERSPAAVAVHDKQAWLELFAAHHVVEDPVGSRPHCSDRSEVGNARGGAGALAGFYDTFIAPNDIRFEVEQDFVQGLRVVRDLTIVIIMAPGVVVRTPMHLLYELREEAGELKIFRLAAHWELAPMLRQQLGLAPAKLKVGLAMGWRMLRHLGVSGLLGFCRALSSVGRRGEERAGLFVRCFNEGNVDALSNLFEHSSDEAAQRGRDALAGGGSLTPGKTIAAGSFVSCSALLERDDTTVPVVLLFEFDRRNLSLLDFRLFVDTVA